MKGLDIVQLAMKHVGEKYILGTLVPKNSATYNGPWDCAEFCSWVIYQLTGKLYGCANNYGDPTTADAYTGFWARDAEKIGQKVSINEAVQTPGAFLLRIAGNGLVGHIVISQGNGQTVEAHSKNTGVIKSGTSGRRWDYGILVPGIEYQKVHIENIHVVNKKPSTIIYRLMEPKMKGDKVKAIQKALGILQTTGVYGIETYNAVKAFQYKNGLVADGEVGPKTAKALKIEL